MLISMQIDFDIHKAIENERRGFDEPPHPALRRLLNLPDETQKSSEAGVPIQTGRPWREGQLEVPHGSFARMAYQRGSQLIEGQFLNGKLVVAGREFETLSGAASALARTKDGSVPNLNGWNYWEARYPGSDLWIPLRALRDVRKAQFQEAI